MLINIFCLLYRILVNMLEPIPKTGRIIDCFQHCSNVSRFLQHQKKKKHKQTITRIPDKLWDEIITVFPIEKLVNTVGRPIVPYRKVMDGIVYVLRTGCQWKMLPGEYGSGSTCHRRFQQWVRLDIFKKLWIDALKTCDDKKGIKWSWQSLDSMSIKLPLGGDDRQQSHHRQEQTGHKKAL
jgi:transposase